MDILWITWPIDNLLITRQCFPQAIDNSSRAVDNLARPRRAARARTGGARQRLGSAKSLGSANTMVRATTAASVGGTALPTCLYWLVFVPWNG